MLWIFYRSSFFLLPLLKSPSILSLLSPEESKKQKKKKKTFHLYKYPSSKLSHTHPTVGSSTLITQTHTDRNAQNLSTSIQKMFVIKRAAVCFTESFRTSQEALPTSLINHPSAWWGWWKECFKVFSRYHKPEQGSLGDNEMSVVNGTAISAGMSGWTCKVRQQKMSDQTIRVKMFDCSNHGETSLLRQWLMVIGRNINIP